MRTYYSDYVKHAMRFYVRYSSNAPSEQPRFKTEADKKNWNACQTALKSFALEEIDLFFDLYSSDAQMTEAIVEYGKTHGMTVNHVWNLVNDLERKIAKHRGLL